MIQASIALGILFLICLIIAIWPEKTYPCLFVKKGDIVYNITDGTESVVTKVKSPSTFKIKPRIPFWKRMFKPSGQITDTNL